MDKPHQVYYLLQVSDRVLIGGHEPEHVDWRDWPDTSAYGPHEEKTAVAVQQAAKHLARHYADPTNHGHYVQGYGAYKHAHLTLLMIQAINPSPYAWRIAHRTIRVETVTTVVTESVDAE